MKVPQSTIRHIHQYRLELTSCDTCDISFGVKSDFTSEVWRFSVFRERTIFFLPPLSVCQKYCVLISMITGGLPSVGGRALGPGGFRRRGA